MEAAAKLRLIAAAAASFRAGDGGDLDIEAALKDVDAAEKKAADAAKASAGGKTWYLCPNGHPYVVGECGMGMEVSKCPECKEVIGGINHVMVAGNLTAEGGAIGARTI